MAGNTRTLEKTRRTGGRKTTKTPAKQDAILVLANGEEASETMRIGLTLVGSGVTGVGIGVLEGLARKGKVEWYRNLSPAKKATLLLTVFVAAGMAARWRRKQGDYQTACALEAVAISAFTIVAVIVAEAAVSGDQGELKGLGMLGADADAALANLSPDQLDKLDHVLDEDIRNAAAQLRRMTERGELRMPTDEGDMAGLATYGDEPFNPDDDLDF